MKRFSKRMSTAVIVFAIVGSIFFAYDSNNSNRDVVRADSTPEQEEALAKTRAEKLDELSLHEGLYSEDSVILADTDEEQAKAIAKELHAEVRITKQGDYAVLYLPEDCWIYPRMKL